MYTYTDIEPAKETPTTNLPLRDGSFKGIRRKSFLQCFLSGIMVGALLIASYITLISKLRQFASQTSIHSITDTRNDILNVFQVQAPVYHRCQTPNVSYDDTDHVARTASRDSLGRSTVLEHTFTNSYGKPYIGMQMGLPDFIRAAYAKSRVLRSLFSTLTEKIQPCNVQVDCHSRRSTI